MKKCQIAIFVGIRLNNNNNNNNALHLLFFQRNKHFIFAVIHLKLARNYENKIKKPILKKENNSE